MNIKKIFCVVASILLLIQCVHAKNVLKSLAKGAERNVEQIIGMVTVLSIETTTPIYKNEEANAKLKRVSEKLLPYVNRKNLNYVFKILELPYPNAFAVPGGTVYVTKKLIEMVDDDELAGVLGHELGHIQARHSIKAFERELITKKILDYYSDKSDKVKKNQDLIMIANSVFNELRYSRDNEREADRFGVDFCIKSGYNPYGTVSFFEKLQKLEGGEDSGALKMLRTHPLTSERIEYTKSYIKKRLR